MSTFVAGISSFSLSAMFDWPDSLRSSQSLTAFTNIQQTFSRSLKLIICWDSVKLILCKYQWLNLHYIVQCWASFLLSNEHQAYLHATCKCWVALCCLNKQNKTSCHINGSHRPHRCCPLRIGFNCRQVWVCQSIIPKSALSHGDTGPKNKEDSALGLVQFEYAP